MQDGDAAGRVDRVGHGPQYQAVGIRRIDVRQVLRHGLSGHRQHVAVQQARIEQCLHDHRHAADAINVVHDVAAERFDVGQVRDFRADPVEVGQRQFDLGLMRDGQQVQHGVGGTAERHHHRDGVLERLLGEDVAGGDTASQ